MTTWSEPASGIWKHFRCLSLAEIEALAPGVAERFQEWRLDRQRELKWEKILNPRQD